jgi:hypothetical protein
VKPGAGYDKWATSVSRYSWQADLARASPERAFYIQVAVPMRFVAHISHLYCNCREIPLSLTVVRIGGSLAGGLQVENPIHMSV